MSDTRITFECQRCGECCKKHGGSLNATAEDIKRWKKEGRSDILKHVFIFEFDGKIAGGDLWFNPKTNEELLCCPFLKRSKEKYICLIHNTKPMVCKEYPFGKDDEIEERRIKECKGIRVVK